MAVRVAVDALDEAASDTDRAEMAELLEALARRPWARVVVATRPLSPAGPFGPASLLRRFGIDGPTADNLIDLDGGDHFHAADLEAFAAALLCQEGARYPGPAGRAWQTYRTAPLLQARLARVIARRADRNFLVVALAAVPLSTRSEVRDPDVAGFDPTRLPSTVGDALEDYLAHQDRLHHVRGILTALSYVHGVGIDDPTWQLFATALGYPTSQEDLDQLQASAAADYLLQATLTPPPAGVGDREGRVVRLFHQALIDQLQAGRDQSGDHARIAAAIQAEVRTSGGWDHAPGYARRYLALHAEAAGALPQLVTDVGYLTVADLTTLIGPLERLPAQTRPPQAWILLQAAHRSGTPDPASRLQVLGLAAAHLGFPAVADQYANPAGHPLHPTWAHPLGTPHRILTGHTGTVEAVAAVPLPDGRTLIASGSGDATVRLWDPATLAPVGQPLTGHTGEVYAVAAVPLPDKRTLLASGS